MNDLKARLQQLTPEQRAAFERRLFMGKVGHAHETKTPAGITAVNNHSPAPLSFAQQRLWYLDRLDPGSAAYNLFGGSRIQGDLDIARLETCVTKIIHRHESLRTIFRLQNNKPVQVVLSPQPYTIELIDLTAESPDSQYELMHELAAHVFSKPFDLGQWPLFRIAVARLANQDHAVFMTIHHIISDAWSMGVFLKEMNYHYSDSSDRFDSGLKPLAVQYADYAIWQQAWSKSQRFKEDEAYWREKLSGSLTKLDLPTDFDRPRFQTTSGAFVEISLPLPQVEQIRMYSQDHQASVNMVLLTVFNVLLYRLSGQTDIIVGTPIAGRQYTELEDLIGFFINTIVLRSNLSNNPSLSQLLAQVRETVLEALTHQEYPFEKIVEALAPERDLSRTPVFQVFFNHIRVQDQEALQTQLPTKGLETYQYQSKFDLTFYAFEHEQQIRLTLVYNANLFKKERMAEFLRQYCLVIDQMLASPSLDIDGVNLVTSSAERYLPNPGQTLRIHWDGHVLDRIRSHAIGQPQKVAIEASSTRTTYLELERHILGFSHWLEAQGVSSGTVVGVFGDRSPEFVYTLLSVMKVGAVFCILDPTYPNKRLAQFLLESRAAFLLTSGLENERCASIVQIVQSQLNGDTVSILEGYDFTAVDPDSCPPRWDTPEAIRQKPDDPAYILFTSGTTGKPKAIEGTMRPISHFLAWYAEAFDVTSADRFSLLSGLSHDPVLRDLFAPLWTGATLCIPKLADIVNPARLNHWVEEARLSVLHLTPAMGMLLSNRLSEKKMSAPRQLKCLRYLFFGGDVLTSDHVRQARLKAPNAEMVLFYGATETPQAMGHYRVSDSILEETRKMTARPLSIGQGIRDVQLLVMTKSGKLAGVGEIGEIGVRTPYLSKGYLNDAESTKRKFITNPFTALEEDVIYKTGDLGRYAGDGRVDFFGRADRQVKINGFRIELGAVETCLRNHTDIADAYVTVKQYNPEARQLIAFIVLAENGSVQTATIQEYVAGRLPAYMVPARIVTVQVFPMTANKKVDDKQLLKEIDPAQRVVQHRELETETEFMIASLWKQALNVEAVSTADNFFEIGGHSLLSIEVIASIQNRTGVRVGARDFIYQTLGQLAAAIDEQLNLNHLQASAPKKESLLQWLKNKWSGTNGEL